MSLEECPVLSPSVALRAESFGALAYDFNSRRLTFLKTMELADLVRALDGHRSLAAVLRDQQIPADRWPLYAEAIQRLIDSKMLRLANRDVAHA